MSFGNLAAMTPLLLTLPFLIWVMLRLDRQRGAALQVFGDPAVLARSAALPTQRRRRARLMLRIGALTLGLVAMARPQFGVQAGSLAGTGRDVLVLLDLSRSMNVADVDPSRLAVAKRATIEALAESPGDRVGLVVFGGSAFLQLPLTSDQAAFRRYLDAATSDDLGDPSTDLSAALTTAALTFEHEGVRGFQAVLIVSDGESASGDLEPALVRLRRASIPIFAIGVGTLEGAPVPADSTEAPERWHRDNIGRIVVSRLEEADLEKAARETGGSYVRWTSAHGAAQLSTEIARLDTRTLAARKTTEHADRFQWPLAVAMVGLVLESLIGQRPRRRVR